MNEFEFSNDLHVDVSADRSGIAKVVITQQVAPPAMILLTPYALRRLGRMLIESADKIDEIVDLETLWYES